MRIRFLAALLACLLVLTCTACGQSGANGQPGEWGESSLPPDELAIYTNLLEVVGTTVSDLEGIVCYDNSSMQDAIANFDMRFYAGWQELKEPLAMSLAALRLDTASREVYPLGEGYESDGDFILLEFILSPYFGYGEGVFVKLFDDGAVELSSRSYWEEVYLYRMADTEPLGQVKETMEWIEQQLQTLRYQVQFHAYREDFSDQTPVIKVIAYNERAGAVKLDEVTVERLEGGNWTPVPVLDDAVLFEAADIAPYSLIEIIVSPEALENGRQPGRYRMSAVFRDSSEEAVIAAEYLISTDSINNAYPPIPEMDSENREYYERYVGMWGYYSPFSDNFSEDNYNFHIRPYLLFNGCLWVAGTAVEATEQYGMDFPVEFVEETIQSYFLLSTEQIRGAISRQVAQRPESEYLDLENGIYHFGGQYGGAGSLGVVESHLRDENLLYLTVQWYSWEGEPGSKNRITIRFDENGGFHYIANQVLEA